MVNSLRELRAWLVDICHSVLIRTFLFEWPLESTQLCVIRYVCLSSTYLLLASCLWDAESNCSRRMYCCLPDYLKLQTLKYTVTVYSCVSSGGRKCWMISLWLQSLFCMFRIVLSEKEITKGRYCCHMWWSKWWCLHSTQTGNESITSLSSTL